MVKMRGLEFQCSKGFCSKMFDNIPIENYDWYVYEYEIIYESDNYKLPHFIGGETMRHYVDHIFNESLVIFLNIQGYPKGASNDYIKVYEDFQKSKCEIVFLIADSAFFDIYAKDEKIITEVCSNVQILGCESITIKTNENDNRTRLSVW